MIDFITSLVRFVVVVPTLLVASAFWFVFGFFIWARVAIISSLLFAMQVVLAPFSRGGTSAAAQHKFEQAMGMWGRGFKLIFQTALSKGDSSSEMWETGEEPRGCLGTVGNLVWQSILTIIFWVPLVLLAHHLGWVNLSIVDRIERRVALELGWSLQPEPIEQGTECLGVGAVQRWDGPRTMLATADVNIRQGPGTEYSRLGSVQAGERVMAVGQSAGGTWYLIADGETLRCFVSSNYLIPQ